MHVRDQIVAAVVDRLRMITGDRFGDRVYAHKPIGWDRETLPVVVVVAGPTRADEEDGTENDMVRRRTQIVVHVIDREYADENVAAIVGEHAVAIEAAVPGIREDLDVDRVDYLDDSGVIGVELDLTGGGRCSGTEINFGVSYFTAEGSADRFI